MKVAVVDDESLARKRIVKLLKDNEHISSVWEASSGKEAVDLIREELPDLVFLDIQMTDMSGFDVLKKLDMNELPVIIFVTAFDHFAVKAFDVKAIDFLLKPFKNDRFFDALERGMKTIESREKENFKDKVNALMSFLDNEGNQLLKEESSYLENVVIKRGKKYYFVPVDQIKYITSSAYYAEIFTLNNEKHVYRISMNDFISKLDPANFSRINRSSIINTRQLKEVISEGLGDFSIVMQDGQSFPLSKIYKQDFLRKLNIKS
ncbi:response regulator [Leptobacterium flavescens]|uniref:Response regulator n=1 Tax=Leptobacterium flavescens TaxID=472055 RepID=A0A6P0UP78_9FLAO|nr:LytTR family DNA-binding domain-containing protein [Leptobacterium flavescens]NER14250.1 response regulator [Leptobacterium flavescens]